MTREESRVDYVSLAQMLDCWQVQPELSTYILLAQQLEGTAGNLRDIMTGGYCQVLHGVIMAYIVAESSRWMTDDKERYHVHGIFAAWVAGNIISKFNDQIQSLASQEKVLQSLPGSMKSKIQTFSFSVVTAALIHDIGGEKPSDKDSASADLNLVKAIFAELKTIGRNTQEIILGYILTDYDNPNNPAHFTVHGAMKFDASEVPLGSLIVIVSDLLQIGAFDYLDRVVDDLHFPIDKRPPAYLLLLAVSIHELAQRLAIEHPVEIIPEEIRERVVGILTNSDHYNWEDPPYDPATQERPFDNPESLRDHICSLLGIEIPQRK